MARSSVQPARHSSGSGSRELRSGVRRLQLRRQHTRREPPPLDLRTPSGRRTLPY